VAITRSLAGSPALCHFAGGKSLLRARHGGGGSGVVPAAYFGEDRKMPEAATETEIRALVTRPDNAARSLDAALARRGAGAIIAPVVEIHYRDGVTLDLADVQAVLCTSANGVRALARINPERRLPLFAVGEATAARAHAEGFSAVAAADGNVDDLARLAGA